MRLFSRLQHLLDVIGVIQKPTIKWQSEVDLLIKEIPFISHSYPHFVHSEASDSMASNGHSSRFRRHQSRNQAAAESAATSGLGKSAEHRSSGKKHHVTPQQKHKKNWVYGKFMEVYHDSRIFFLDWILFFSIFFGGVWSSKSGVVGTLVFTGLIEQTAYQELIVFYRTQDCSFHRNYLETIPGHTNTHSLLVKSICLKADHICVGNPVP